MVTLKRTQLNMNLFWSFAAKLTKDGAYTKMNMRLPSTTEYGRMAFAAARGAGHTEANFAFTTVLVRNCSPRCNSGFRKTETNNWAEWLHKITQDQCLGLFSFKANKPLKMQKDC